MKRYDLILRNGSIVTEQGVRLGDIGILEGKISELTPQIPKDAAAAEEIDATSLHILPGLVDVHVHLNEPGRTEWEGIAAGSRSLASGGVTTFFDMPLNSNPPTISPKEFLEKKKIAEAKSIIDYGLLGGLVPENMGCLQDLIACGAIGFKGFMSYSGIEEFSSLNDESLFSGLKKVAEIDSIAMLHAESQVICSQLTAAALREGRTTAEDYVASRPVVSEIEAVQRAVAVAEVTGCKVHIVHASSREVVQRVLQAKRRGVDVTVETCPHYLTLTVEDLERLGAVAKCAPPVRYRQDVESLWEALAAGEIDIVASDHSPCPPEMKEMTGDKNIFTTWGGISAAQSTLNILLEEGYWRRELPLQTIARVTAANPARRFGLYPIKGTIAPGSDADLTVVDLNASFTLQKEHLFYRHPFSPFIGKKFRGRVLYTIARGRKIFERGNIIDNGSRGRMVTKASNKL